MSYNNYNRKGVDSQFAQSNNTRTVSYNAGGGLNERFSKIVQSQKNSSNGNNNIARPSGPSPSLAPAAAPVRPNNNSSVFSRLRGAKPTVAAKKNIQNRLGKTIGGGIKKKSGPTSMAGVVKNGKSTHGGPKRGSVVVAAKVGGKKGAVVVEGKKPIQKGSNKKVVKKPATAEDLDRAIDAYMMKDPKTAQAKLDADMNAYMAEAEDILMDDNL